MLFVALFNAHPGSEPARTARRMAWQAPVGTEILAEYWLQTPNPAVVAIVKADSIGQIWAGLFGWSEFFEISVYPAVTAEEGLELLKQRPAG